MPSSSIPSMLVAAIANSTSDRGLSFSAISRACMIPVESRTQLTLMSG